MDKPFSIIYEEFKRGLTNLINESGLSPFIVESVLQNYLYEVSNLAKNQYQIDRIRYEKSLLEKKDDEDEENPIL